RKGLIEGTLYTTEDDLSVIGKAVFSRFVGPDKVNLEMTVASDDIDQNKPKPIKRGAFLVAPTFRYQLFRPLGHLEDPFSRTLVPRSSEVFVGAVWSEETFAATEVRKRDVFAGLSARGLPGIGVDQTFDVTLQATLFTAKRSGMDELEPG